MLPLPALRAEHVKLARAVRLDAPVVACWPSDRRELTGSTRFLRVALPKNARVDLLKRIPLFAQCSKSDLKRIARIAEEIEFEAGKLLMREGESGHEVFVVVRGQLEVWRRREGGQIANLGPGEVVGEMALLSKKPRNATVRAATTVAPPPDHRHRLPEASRSDTRVMAQDRERIGGPRAGRRAASALPRLSTRSGYFAVRSNLPPRLRFVWAQTRFQCLNPPESP